MYILEDKLKDVYFLKLSIEKCIFQGILFRKMCIFEDKHKDIYFKRYYTARSIFIEHYTYICTF